MKFLRNFGLGILWAALFPLLCVVIALIAVYGVFTFIVEFVIMLIHFFQGKIWFDKGHFNAHTWQYASE